MSRLAPITHVERAEIAELWVQIADMRAHSAGAESAHRALLGAYATSTFSGPFAAFVEQHGAT